MKQARYFNDGTSRYDDEDYTVSNIEYDQNGNILSLARKGLLKMNISEKDPTQIDKSYGQIDDLYYSYSENYNGIRSNRLRSVSDYASQSFGLAGDFQDNNQTSSPDYEYDLSGNLISDNNKGIRKIIYNHLNLPEIIKFETGNIILNTYDAAGIKLKSQIIEGGVPLRTTYYKNGFIYEQKSTDERLKLAFFGTAEGRIVKKERGFVYEYHYKDHLGNLRVAFQAQEDQERERFSLTMEADSSQKEEAEFLNVAAARSDQKDKEGHYSAALENSKQAISKTIAVKKGDKIKASVFATHDPAIAETDPTKVLEEAKKDVLLSLGAAAAGTINTNPTQQEIEIPLNPEITPARTETIKTPKVQLNVLDFIPVIRNLRELNRAKKAKGLEPDTYFVPKGELVLELRDSTDSLIFEKREKLTIYSAVSWEKLVSDLEIKEDGNLKVYIDNSSSDKVYFDEFIIERTEATVAVVVQENHYYPFGMNMKGIEELDIQSIDGKDEHRWQFNGVEKNESFGLNWNETFYRTYDMQLGRWNHIDPKPTYSQTTYMGMGNNPVSYSDALGDTTYVDVNSGKYTFKGSDSDGIMFAVDGKTTLQLTTIDTKNTINVNGTNVPTPVWIGGTIDDNNEILKKFVVSQFKNVGLDESDFKSISISNEANAGFGVGTYKVFKNKISFLEKGEWSFFIKGSEKDLNFANMISNINNLHNKLSHEEFHTKDKDDVGSDSNAMFYYDETKPFSSNFKGWKASREVRAIQHQQSLPSWQKTDYIHKMGVQQYEQENRNIWFGL